MSNIKFSQKNNLIVKHKNGDYFSKDLELFKEHCPGHPLNTELSKANKFSYARLDGLMLSELLEIITIEEILENREQEKQSEPEPRTESEIISLLVKHFGLDEKDLKALSQIIPLLVTKTDEEIISAVSVLLGEDPEADKIEGENPDKTIPSGNNTTYNDRLAAYIERYGEDYVLASVEDVAIMFQFLKFPMPDPQNESHFHLKDLVGVKFSDLPFSKPNEEESIALLYKKGTKDSLEEQKAPDASDNKTEQPVAQPIERDNVNKFTKRILDAKTIAEVEAILKEDIEGGERSTVQKAGLKQIEKLKAVTPEENPDKKKD